MSRPCSCALGSINVGAKRWITRADLFEQIRDACTYLDSENLLTVSLQTAALRASLSEFHFSRVFKEAMGIAPSCYLQKRRLNFAKEQLARTTQWVTEIAFDCGYMNASAFTRAFTKEFGMSPSEFRKFSKASG